MKRLKLLQFVAAAVASLGLVLPSGVLAADAGQTAPPASAAEAPSILDISLGKGGTLTGQVLDAQGLPMVNASVAVRNAGGDVASTVTNAQGNFSIRGLQGGVYEVACGDSSGVFRLWTAGSSPPSANNGVLIVAGGPVSRGQCCAGRCGTGRCDPGYAGPRLPGWPTNGQVVVAGLLIAGIAGGIVAIATSTQQQQPSS